MLWRGRLSETEIPGKEERKRENGALKILGLKISVECLISESTNGLEEEDDDDVAIKEEDTTKHYNYSPSP